MMKTNHKLTTTLVVFLLLGLPSVFAIQQMTPNTITKTIIDDTPTPAPPVPTRGNVYGGGSLDCYHTFVFRGTASVYDPIEKRNIRAFAWGRNNCPTINPDFIEARERYANHRWNWGRDLWTEEKYLVSFMPKESVSGTSYEEFQQRRLEMRGL